MPVRVPEVAAVLGLVMAMLVAKRLPVLATLPWTQIIGITAFTFAIYLCLKLFQFELARVEAGE